MAHSWLIGNKTFTTISKKSTRVSPKNLKVREFVENNFMVNFSKGRKSEKVSNSLPQKGGEPQGLKYQDFSTQSLP